MKKLSIFLLGALGMLAATSCEEKIEPAIPQANPQEPILTVQDIITEKAGVLASTGVLNLEDYRAEGATLEVIDLIDATNLPKGATISYKVEFSNDATFARNYTVNTTEGADGKYYVSASDWNDAHLYLFGKSPKVKVAFYRVPAYVNLDGSDYRLNSADYYVAEGTIEETCMDNGFTISDAYYFLSDATSWSLGDATVMDEFKFEHSDADVYDDPVFTFKFKITEEILAEKNGGIYWKICSQEGMDINDWATGIYGPEDNGDENLDGILVDTNAQAGLLTEAGTYRLTINMEEMTYSFELLLQPDILYTPGGANGWAQTASAYLQLNETKGYYGLTPIDDQGFKVCTENSWDDAYTYGAADATPALSGTLALGQAAAGNIMVPATALYWVSVQFDPTSYALTTYALTEVTQVGVIGSFAASGWGSDVVMTSADNATWTADLTLAAGDQFKFRFNENWDFNFGGTLSAVTGSSNYNANCVLDGDNYTVAEAGNYTLTLNLLGGVPTATLVKK